jgi:hypothetical protein
VKPSAQVAGLVKPSLWLQGINPVSKNTVERQLQTLPFFFQSNPYFGIFAPQ